MELNDSDDFDRVLMLASGSLYDADDQPVSPRDERAVLAFNGVSVTSDEFEFEFMPGRESAGKFYLVCRFFNVGFD